MENLPLTNLERKIISQLLKNCKSKNVENSLREILFSNKDVVKTIHKNMPDLRESSLKELSLIKNY